MKPGVVIATYNEIENIVPIVHALGLSVPEAKVIVVDDQSPDGTAEMVRSQCDSDRVKIRVRTGPKSYAQSILEGFEIALELGLDRVVTLDADFSHDPNAVPILLEDSATYDIVVGSRYVHGVRVLDWQLRRLLLSVIANRYVRALTGLDVEDCTSGFRCYSERVLVALLNQRRFRSSGYSFLVEFLFRAHQAGFSIGEVPIVFSERRVGQSKMNTGMIIEAAFLPLTFLGAKIRSKLSRAK